MTPNWKIFSQKFLNGKWFKIEEEPKQYDLEPSEEEEKSFSEMNEDEQYDYFCVEPLKTQPEIPPPTKMSDFKDNKLKRTMKKSDLLEGVPTLKNLNQNFKRY